jgi:hypothetical protein
LATAGDHLRLWEITDEINNANNTIGANNHVGFRQKKLIHKSILTNVRIIQIKYFGMIKRENKLKQLIL